MALAVACLVAASMAAGVPARAEQWGSEPLQPREATTKPDHSRLEAGQDPTQVVLKFAEGTDVRLRNGRFVSPSGRHNPVSVNEALAAFGAVPGRDHSVDEARLDEVRRRAERRSGRQQADLNLYYHLAVPEGTDTAALLDGLNAQSIVELAYAAVPTIEAGHTFPTPDFTSRQGYTDPAPGGIDSDYANGLAGGDGTGVRVVDVERGWNFDHEDLGAPGSTLISGVIRPGSVEHGTAVLGELVANDNGIGVGGMVPAASVAASSACRRLDASGRDCATSSVAAAILEATDHLLATGVSGRVILVEQQTALGRHHPSHRPGRSSGYPVEIVPEAYDAIVTAVDNGIVVVEAAGNGAWNLDDYQDSGGDHILRRSVRDSGAIMVGAGCPPPPVAAHANCARDRQSVDEQFWGSNYGTRIDVQGWGATVTTTGYGDFFGIDAEANDPDRYYTSGFLGTSSASAMVAGAVAAVQGRAIHLFGGPLPPLSLRSLLVDTGTPQSPADAAAKPIGPRPDLRTAFDYLWLRSFGT